MGKREVGSTDEMAGPQTKNKIASLCLDHCPLSHEGIRNAH